MCHQIDVANSNQYSSIAIKENNKKTKKNQHLKNSFSISPPTSNAIFSVCDGWRTRYTCLPQGVPELY